MSLFAIDFHEDSKSIYSAIYRMLSTFNMQGHQKDFQWKHSIASQSEQKWQLTDFKNKNKKQGP